MPTNRDIIATLIDRFEPEFRDAFFAAIDDISSRADLAGVVTALERGDVAGAIAALHLEAGAFGELDRVIAEAYRLGGISTAASFPTRLPTGERLVIRFDARNTRAEMWLGQYSSELITAILDDQRVAIRNALEAALADGLNPRVAALDIVGRYNSQTRQREGGILGLTAAFEEYARTAQAELESGATAQMRNYLTRSLRDKRFDASVIKSIEQGIGLTKTQVARIVQRYRDKLLFARGEMIARTEAGAALHSAQDEALEQAIETGKVSRDMVSRVWRSAGDRRVRDTHAAINGQKQPKDKPFKSPSGALLRYPHDPLAPAAEVINCRCWAEPAIDFLKGIM